MKFYLDTINNYINLPRLNLVILHCILTNQNPSVVTTLKVNQATITSLTLNLTLQATIQHRTPNSLEAISATPISSTTLGAMAAISSILETTSSLKLLYLHSLPTLWCDNLGALALASNPVYHARTKPIEVDYHFIHEKVVNQDVTT